MTDRFEFHPISEIFPLLPEEGLESLAADIKQNGLLTPILLFEGKILDGRNRYQACEIADVGAVYETFDGTTVEQALDYVVSVNLHRRHLNEFQKYEAISKVGDIREKAKTRQVEGAKEGGKIAGRGKSKSNLSLGPRLTLSTQQNQYDSENKNGEGGGRVSEQIAGIIGISRATVDRMRRLERDAPENLLDAIRRGDLSVWGSHEAMLAIEKDYLAQIVDATDPNDLQKRLRSEVLARVVIPKKKRTAPALQSTRPFQDTDSIEMTLGRLQQYWIQSTPATRSQFMTWVRENHEKYPSQEGPSNEER